MEDKIAVIHLEQAVGRYRAHDHYSVIGITNKGKEILHRYPPEHHLHLHLDSLFILSSIEISNDSHEVICRFCNQLQFHGHGFIKSLRSYNNVSVSFQ